MSGKEKMLLTLIRAGIDGEVKEDFPALTEGQTAEILQLATEQTTVGITMDGLQKLMPNSIGHNSLIIKWYGLTEMIAAMNEKTSEVACNIFTKLTREGYKPVVTHHMNVR